MIDSQKRQLVKQAKMSGRVAEFGRRTPTPSSSSLLFIIIRRFRSDAALEAIRKASESKNPNLVLYNYPSFSASFAALFAYLYHSRLNLPCLILPFSSHIPFSVEDLCIDGMNTCYFLDFLGPKGFALQLSTNTSSKVFAFDHRKSMLSRMEDSDTDFNVNFNLNLHKSTSVAVYEYFSAKLDHIKQDTDDDSLCLLNQQDRDRMEIMLKYIEAGDLRNSSLPDIEAFHIGLKEWRSKLNCITNSNMYQQLMQLCPAHLITKGNSYLSSQKTDVNKLLHKVFRVSLGRGFYGECLGVRADGNSVYYADELAKELSRRSAAAGLRPIGAVIYMQRTNLKMCLRTTDSCIDTSEIAKAYGGGGSPSSSSFMIRMDEYNLWLSRHSSSKCWG